MAPPVSAPPPLANRPLYHAAPKPLSAGLDIPQKQLLLGRMAALSKNWTPEQRAKFLKVATESVATARARFSSWSIKTQVKCACLRRDCLMTVVLPDNGVLVDPIPKRLIWSSKVLVEHAHLFLPSCVWTLFLFFLLVHDFFFQLEIRRRKDDSYFCTRTLYCWFYSFVMCIPSYCFDEQDGQLAGSVLLVNGGLYNVFAGRVEECTRFFLSLLNLATYVFSLSPLSLLNMTTDMLAPAIVNFGLQREIKPIILFGLPEPQLMIEERMLNTTSSDRLMCIMRIIELLLLCFTAAWPSSLGLANSDILKHGKASSSSITRNPRLTLVFTVPSLRACLLCQGRPGGVLLRTAIATSGFQGTPFPLLLLLPIA